MPQKKEYLEKFKFLVEYNIKTGVNVNNPIQEVEEVVDDEIPSVEDNSELPDSYENTEEIEKINTEELVKKDDLERVKEIQDLQTQKIETFDEYVKTVEAELETLKISIQDIDNLKSNLEIVRDQVKKITPPTPEESLEHMAKVSGGITVEDYWKKYMEDNEPMKKVVKNEEESDFVEYKVPVTDLTNFSAMDIKKSFYEYE